MARESDTPPESRIASNPDTIRSWDERHALVPVRRDVGGEQRLAVIREDERDSTAQELSWDEFQRALDRQGKVVVYDEGSYAVRDRVAAADAETLATDEPDRADGRESDADPTVDRSAAVDESGAVDTGATTTESPTGHAAIPTDEDEGKVVVNATGEDVGLVVDVDDGQMYVDPTPSLTDRIRSALGWGSHDEDASPIDASHVERIEAEQVVLDVDHERDHDADRDRER